MRGCACPGGLDPFAILRPLLLMMNWICPSAFAVSRWPTRGLCRSQTSMLSVLLVCAGDVGAATSFDEGKQN